MTNRKMKKKLREAFAHGTPDISQDIVTATLFSEQPEREEMIVVPEQQKKPIQFPIFRAAAAACAVIAVLAISINLITNQPGSAGTEPTTALEYITPGEAKQIALQATPQIVGLQITDYLCDIDLNSDAPIYEISFRLGNGLYHYKIDPVTGNIVEDYVLNAVSYISEADAKGIAMACVQLTESQITAYSIELKYDGKPYYYSIRFVSGNIRYTFEIDAITGNVLNTAVDSIDITIPDIPVVVITPVEVALKHAGFTLEQVANLECSEDLDDEVPHIDVSFITNGLKYEYEVRPNGTILEVETEPMEDDFISPTEAITLFYHYLNITPQPLAVNLNWEIVKYEDRMCYKIIHTNTDGSAIRMKIDAETGTLMLKENSTELQPVPIDPTPPDGKISADRATTIALQQVGLSSTRLVSDFEIEADADDEYPHYDISFVYQGVEYEFEIGMYDGGQILDREAEPED